jgi:hypothetical protein
MDNRWSGIVLLMRLRSRTESAIGVADLWPCRHDVLPALNDYDRDGLTLGDLPPVRPAGPSGWDSRWRGAPEPGAWSLLRAGGESWGCRRDAGAAWRAVRG